MVPTNVLTVAQQTAVDNLLNQAFQFVVDFLYSLVSSMLDFITQPAILGALVVIAMIFIAKKWITRRKVSM